MINIVNFIRAVEPRGPIDLFEPVRRQMEIIRGFGFPATWLLQYDALVTGPFVSFLKENMPANHEVGLWFEMNQRHCEAAKVEWRGRPGYEWDWSPSVAFSIGYTPEERERLVDAAAATFLELWGEYPKSVASWNLDAIAMARFADRYGVKAFAVCRDQIDTDGFTIWGAPIAGYFPSRINSWSPAVDKAQQIGAPVFRMLGQDPVYYYDKYYRLPNGEMTDHPDTMEPVWVAGQSKGFVDRYFDMVLDAPCILLSYLQLGQENSFGWPAMAHGFEMQMKRLAGRVSGRECVVSTLGASGERFRNRFDTTPSQAQVQLHDPFGNTNPAERSVWFQNRYYRCNLHFKGNLPYLRDLTLYRDSFPQPFLHKPTRDVKVAQRMLSALDSYHWSESRERLAGGWFRANGRDLRLLETPEAHEFRDSLAVNLKTDSAGRLSVKFVKREIWIHGDAEFSLCFEWDPKKSAFQSVKGNRAHFEQSGFGYSVSVAEGSANRTAFGWTARSAHGRLVLSLAD